MSQSQIDVLHSLITKLQDEQKEEYKGQKILGFKLSIHKDGSGKPQWRAYGWYKGKSANIYIGKDAEKAEKKIKAWVKKHPHFEQFIRENS